MAQYFFDFKDIVEGFNNSAGNGAVLPGLTRFLGPNVNSNYEQYVSRSPLGGLATWHKNSAAGSGNFSSSFMYALNGVTAADWEILIKAVCHQYNGGSFTNDGIAVFLRSQTTLTSYSDGYEIGLPGTITATTTFMRKRVANASTTIGGSGGGITRAVPMWLRVQLSGTTLNMRTWADGASEPGTWGNTATDSDVVGAGYCSFGNTGASGTGFGTSAGTRYTFYQVGFGTNGDAAPASLVRNVSGTVTTPASAAADGYIVRLYSRASGKLLAETLTNSLGAFSFAINYTGLVYAIAVDSVGNAWKAQIHDLITPSV